MSIFYLLETFCYDTAENEPCKVCALSVYRLLLQIPQVLQRATNLQKLHSIKLAGTDRVKERIVQSFELVGLHVPEILSPAAPIGDPLALADQRARGLAGQQPYFLILAQDPVDEGLVFKPIDNIECRIGTLTGNENPKLDKGHFLGWHALQLVRPT